MVLGRNTDHASQKQPESHEKLHERARSLQCISYSHRKRKNDMVHPRFHNKKLHKSRNAAAFFWKRPQMCHLCARWAVSTSPARNAARTPQNHQICTSPCPGSVPEVSRKCPGSVPEVSRGSWAVPGRVLGHAEANSICFHQNPPSDPAPAV